MNPLYLGMASVWLLSLAFYRSQLRSSRTFVTTIGALILWAFLALRGPDVGTDVHSYLTGLQMARSNGNLLIGERIFNFEPGFSTYLSIVAHWDIGEQKFLALTAALTIIPVAVSVLQFSRQPALSLFLYATLGFYAFAFSGLRQAWAIALCFLALGSIRNRRLVTFVAIVAFASLLHLSALAFLPAYWIYRVGPHRLDIPVGILGLTLIWILREPVYSVLYRLYRDGEVTVDTTGAVTLFLIIALAWIAAIMLYSPATPPTNHDQMVIAWRNYLYIAAAIQALASISFIIGRVGQYYQIFIILLIPELVSRQRDPVSKFAIFAVATIAGALLLSQQAPFFQILPYSFANGS